MGAPLQPASLCLRELSLQPAQNEQRAIFCRIARTSLETAGISGNNQDPINWGPPALNFSSGIAALNDGQSSFNRARTDGFSGSAAIYRGRHDPTIGGDFRKQQFNDFFQQDPRGIFTFTGGATQGTANSATASGSDLADFLIGVPDASSIAFRQRG